MAIPSSKCNFYEMHLEIFFIPASPSAKRLNRKVMFERFRLLREGRRKEAARISSGRDTASVFPPHVSAKSEQSRSC